jgi:hypothetical protein
MLFPKIISDALSYTNASQRTLDKDWLIPKFA